ncbi:hypothetical protein LOY47_20280 [Pseudomonas brassicacearum]|uniref:hypothetical protein n=1 Tax=Pseudomonas brassicacearum TaxID=930166 RepID=UPI00215F52CB|nr:hypothetical protein [Pseudomonas brassicacearum]UVM42841.1 hypothetical protein LOY47_20280 [Pseudomonas brassicacearum]
MKQYRGPILFFSVMISLFVLLQLWHARSASEDKKEERERQLKGTALVMNAQSQKTVDDTRLDSVTYQDGIMRISYTLTKTSKDEIDSDAFTKDKKALAASVSCDEKGLGQFVKSGLLIKYTINDSSSAPITDFQISKSDCL